MPIEPLKLFERPLKDGGVTHGDNSDVVLQFQGNMRHQNSESEIQFKLITGGGTSHVAKYILFFFFSRLLRLTCVCADVAAQQPRPGESLSTGGAHTGQGV